MIRMSLVALFLGCIFTVNTFAVSNSGQIDYSEIEAQERIQIVEEFTYRLNTKSTCKLNPSWDDAGSGADLDGYFFIPSVGQSEYIIGGFATQNKKSGKNCVVVVSEPSNNPKGTPRLLATPIDWKLIWKDKGSGAKKDGSIWEAVLPDRNYKCLGSIPQIGYEKPNIPKYRCVHKNLVKKIVTKIIAWSDKGSGADVDATMFRLPNTGSFVTVPVKINIVEAYDLKANASAEPDPQLVKSILSKRMVQIKADIESQLNAKAEQQKKEAEQKRIKTAKQKELTEEAEQKQLAKEAEQAQFAKESEQERLAREAKHKQLAEEAEQVRLAEEEVKQKKLEKEAEKKRKADKAEQARLEEEAKQKQLAYEAEQKILIEEPEQKYLTEESSKTGSTFKNSSEANNSNNSIDTKNSSIPYFAELLLVICIILLIITVRYISSIFVNGKS